MAHLEPLSPDASPELAADFAYFEGILGVVPNSLLTLQRRPAIVQGFSALVRAVMDPAGEVDLGFKRLVANVASRAAGCRYCEAHSALAARVRGVSEPKIEALWEYPTSPLFTRAERAALDFALAAGSAPNAVDAELMARLREHWSEGQIVELLAVVCLYGFLNRWNDSLATELEAPAAALAGRLLERAGWRAGKHLR